MNKTIACTLAALSIAAMACSVSSEPEEEGTAASSEELTTSSIYWCLVDDTNHMTGYCNKSPGNPNRACSAIVLDSECPVGQLATYMSTTVCFNGDNTTSYVRQSNVRCH